MTSTSVVVIYSGGMDSFTVLHKALRSGLMVYALSFDYGQRHSKELIYATRVCQFLKVNHKVVDISGINGLLGGSALTSNVEVPKGGYHADDGSLPTVVPNRNMIMLSLAVAYAVSIGANEVHYGPHQGDVAIYPDCRPEFVDAMNAVTQIANWSPVTIVAPYLYASKQDILTEGVEMGLDYSQTWTCYKGEDLACGHCGACLGRLESFHGLNLKDPLSYQSKVKAKCTV